ncbi:hypothetical protein SNEBB_009145 [Seison nebaliae]|nr:hypothetical protein SNEBB_009145 [Seison nebaliae]
MQLVLANEFVVNEYEVPKKSWTKYGDFDKETEMFAISQHNITSIYQIKDRKHFNLVLTITTELPNGINLVKWMHYLEEETIHLLLMDWKGSMRIYRFNQKSLSNAEEDVNNSHNVNLNLIEDFIEFIPNEDYSIITVNFFDDCANSTKTFNGSSEKIGDMLTIDNREKLMIWDTYTCRPIWCIKNIFVNLFQLNVCHPFRNFIRMCNELGMNERNGLSSRFNSAIIEMDLFFLIHSSNELFIIKNLFQSINDNSSISVQHFMTQKYHKRIIDTEESFTCDGIEDLLLFRSYSILSPQSILMRINVKCVNEKTSNDESPKHLLDSFTPVYSSTTSSVQLIGSEKKRLKKSFLKQSISSGSRLLSDLLPMPTNILMSAANNLLNYSEETNLSTNSGNDEAKKVVYKKYDMIFSSFIEGSSTSSPTTIDKSVDDLYVKIMKKRPSPGTNLVEFSKFLTVTYGDGQHVLLLLFISRLNNLEIYELSHRRFLGNIEMKKFVLDIQLVDEVKEDDLTSISFLTLNSDCSIVIFKLSLKSTFFPFSISENERPIDEQFELLIGGKCVNKENEIEIIDLTSNWEVERLTSSPFIRSSNSQELMMFNYFQKCYETNIFILSLDNGEISLIDILPSTSSNKKTSSFRIIEQKQSFINVSKNSSNYPIIMKMSKSLKKSNEKNWRPYMAVGYSNGDIGIIDCIDYQLVRYWSQQQFPIKGLTWLSDSSIISWTSNHTSTLSNPLETKYLQYYTIRQQQQLSKLQTKYRNDVQFYCMRTGQVKTFRSSTKEKSPIRDCVVSSLENYLIIVFEFRIPFEIWNCRDLTLIRRVAKNCPCINLFTWLPTKSYLGDNEKVKREDFIMTDVMHNIYHVGIEGRSLKEGEKIPKLNRSQIGYITALATKSNIVIFTNTHKFIYLWKTRKNRSNSKFNSTTSKMEMEESTEDEIDSMHLDNFGHILKLSLAPGKCSSYLLALTNSHILLIDFNKKIVELAISITTDLKFTYLSSLLVRKDVVINNSTINRLTRIMIPSLEWITSTQFCIFAYDGMVASEDELLTSNHFPIFTVRLSDLDMMKVQIKSASLKFFYITSDNQLVNTKNILLDQLYGCLSNISKNVKSSSKFSQLTSYVTNGIDLILLHKSFETSLNFQHREVTRDIYFHFYHLNILLAHLQHEIYQNINSFNDNCLGRIRWIVEMIKHILNDLQDNQFARLLLMDMRKHTYHLLLALVNFIRQQWKRMEKNCFQEFRSSCPTFKIENFNSILENCDLKMIILLADVGRVNDEFKSENEISELLLRKRTSLIERYKSTRNWKKLGMVLQSMPDNTK